MEPRRLFQDAYLSRSQFGKDDLVTREITKQYAKAGGVSFQSAERQIKQVKNSGNLFNFIQARAIGKNQKVQRPVFRTSPKQNVQEI